MIYLDNTTQSQQVYIPRQVIQTATTREINNITSGDVINIVDEKLEPYYNSAETDTQIENAVAAESARCEETYAKISDIPDVSEFVTSADVKSQVEAYNYITSADLPDVSDFITSADAKTQIDEAIGVESARCEDTYAKIEDIPDVSNLVTKEEFNELSGTVIELQQSISGFASEEYVDNAVDGAIDYVDDQFSSYSQEFTGYLAEKQDITAMTAYYTSAETDTAIENAIAAEVERADSTYATPSDIPDVSEFVTTGDLASYALSADVDTLVENAIAVESARCEETYAKPDDVSSAVNEAVNEFALGLAYLGVVNDVSESNGTVTITKTGLVSGEITTGLTDTFNLPDVSNFVTSADVETQITDKNYITSATVKDVFVNFDVTSGDSSIGSYIRYEKLGGGYKGRIFGRYINGEPIISDQTLTNLQLPTSADVETQITNKNYVTSATVQTQIDGNLSAYTPTSNFATINGSAITEGGNIIIEGGGGVDSGLTERVDEIEEVTSRALNDLNTRFSAYTPTSGFATINGSGITDGGNIIIEGGGGGGNANIIELTQQEYDALTAYTEDALYVITDAEEVDLNDYATSGDIQTLSAATVTALGNKADKASTTATSSGYWFPRWNSDGIITGRTSVQTASFTVNGDSRSILNTSSSALPNVYAPTTAGTSGQIPVSNGSGAPSWSSFKLWFGSQSDYDAITTKDSNTIYFVQ